MGRYINQTDIENVFGTTFVAQWSSFTGGNTPAANTTRITVAIAQAENMVDSKLRNGPFIIPITATGGGVPAEITDAAAKLAGWWLWNTRSLSQAKETIKQMTETYQEVMRLLLSIKGGSYPMDAVLNTQRTNTPFVVG